MLRIERIQKIVKKETRSLSYHHVQKIVVNVVFYMLFPIPPRHVTGVSIFPQH